MYVMNDIKMSERIGTNFSVKNGSSEMDNVATVTSKGHKSIQNDINVSKKQAAQNKNSLKTSPLKDKITSHEKQTSSLSIFETWRKGQSQGKNGKISLHLSSKKKQLRQKGSSSNWN